MIYGYAESLEVEEEIKKVKISGNIYESKVVIIASGAKPKPLGVTNEARL